MLVSLLMSIIAIPLIWDVWFSKISLINWVLVSILLGLKLWFIKRQTLKIFAIILV